jgi:hypothetical protein
MNTINRANDNQIIAPFDQGWWLVSKQMWDDVRLFVTVGHRVPVRAQIAGGSKKSWKLERIKTSSKAKKARLAECKCTFPRRSENSAMVPLARGHKVFSFSFLL